MSGNVLLEIACFNLQSAIIAQENGADRIEFCDGYDFGGTTPNLELTRQITNAIAIPVNVMIRPRGGNFVYSDEEFVLMKSDIIKFKKLKISGFVFGILNENKSINYEQNSQLVALAQPIPCTFHRAFDEVASIFESLEELIQCGFTTILTSGKAQNALEGITTLSEIIKAANDRIVIMPGGGIRAYNIENIVNQTAAKYIHSSAITDENQTANATEIRNLKVRLSS